MKDRETNRVRAAVVATTDKATLQGFVASHVRTGAMVYTDEAAVPTLCYRHESVQHSANEYVREIAHTNGMEAFWSMLKRGYIGACHKMRPKHLGRYVAEFSGRHNIRPADTHRQMARVVEGMVGKRLRYHTLIADNGLSSGARS